MDALGVLSLLPSCPGWWLLIGHSTADVTATAAVSALSGRGDRCCCESLGGVVWFPTRPMSVEEWRAACCYLGDRSTPPMICMTQTQSRLQGSLEEDVIKNPAFITCRSKASCSSTDSITTQTRVCKVLAEKILPGVPEMIRQGLWQEQMKRIE